MLVFPVQLVIIWLKSDTLTHQVPKHPWRFCHSTLTCRCPICAGSLARHGGRWPANPAQVHKARSGKQVTGPQVPLQPGTWTVNWDMTPTFPTSPGPSTLGPVLSLLSLAFRLASLLCQQHGQLGPGSESSVCSSLCSPASKDRRALKSTSVHPGGHYALFLDLQKELSTYLNPVLPNHLTPCLYGPQWAMRHAFQHP